MKKLMEKETIGRILCILFIIVIFIGIGWFVVNKDRIFPEPKIVSCKDYYAVVHRVWFDDKYPDLKTAKEYANGLSIQHREDCEYDDGHIENHKLEI